MPAIRITLLVHALRTRMNQRTVLGALVFAGCSGAAFTAQTQAQEATPGSGAIGGALATPFTDQVFTGEGFVGEVANLAKGQAFMAVVVAEPQPGEESREARALLYGNRESQIREWFSGEIRGERLDLVSEGRAELQGEWNSDGVTGAITLPEGPIIPIDAVPISGPAGLYTVEVFPDGRVEGISESGMELAGQVEPESGPDNGYPLAGTVTPPNEIPLPFEIVFFTDRLGGGPPSRLIVLNDGRMLGGAMRKDGDFFNGTEPLAAE